MRHFPQRADDRRAHRNVGHEMPVHDVDMDAIRAGSLGLGHLIAQAGEIGRKDRWSKHYGAGHIASLSLRYRRMRVVGRAVMVELGPGSCFELGDDALSQDLAEFDAPLIEASRCSRSRPG